MANANDGSDWSYRMLIEDRYKRMAVMRRSIRISAIAQLVYVCVRTLWHSIPFLTGEPPLTASTEWIFYAGVALFAFRAWAFGFGRAQHEKLGAIMAYSVMSALLTAELVLVFYMYHVDEKMMGRKSGRQYPWMLATHAAPALRLAPSTVKAAAEWFERALDVCGIVASFANVYVTKEYVMEKKEQAAAAEGKRD